MTDEIAADLEESEARLKAEGDRRANNLRMSGLEDKHIQALEQWAYNRRPFDQYVARSPQDFDALAGDSGDYYGTMEDFWHSYESAYPYQEGEKRMTSPYANSEDPWEAGYKSAGSGNWESAYRNWKGAAHRSEWMRDQYRKGFMEGRGDVHVPHSSEGHE